MKKIFVFDLDNTLRSTNLKAILPNTRKLILAIAENPDYVLALATGRGTSKLDVLGDLSPYFKYKILVNGALTLENDKVVDDHHIDASVIRQIINLANQKNIAVGLVGMDKEVVTKIDKHVEAASDNFVDIKPIADPMFYIHNNIYQMWIYHKNEDSIEKEIKNNLNIEIYHWHDGGFDVVKKGVSKANALLTLKQKYPNHQVIAIGDGHNDLDMIALADIGIIMENSRWIQESKGNYQLIGPHVDSDTLYEFLIKHNII